MNSTTIDLLYVGMQIAQGKNKRFIYYSHVASFHSLLQMNFEIADEDFDFDELCRDISGEITNS